MVRSLEVMKLSVKRNAKGDDCQDKMDISSEWDRYINFQYIRYKVETTVNLRRENENWTLARFVPPASRFIEILRAPGETINFSGNRII